MPGYPTRKLLFGGPDTLTKAAIFKIKPLVHSCALEAVCAKTITKAYTEPG